MSVLAVVLTLAAVAALALGAAALHAVRGLRRQIADLCAALPARAATPDRAPADDAEAAGAAAPVPAARREAGPRVPLTEVRAAVAEALAEERERELAEARAFWAAQEAREAADSPFGSCGLAGYDEEAGANGADADGLPPFDAAELDPASLPGLSEMLDGRLFLPRQVDAWDLDSLRPAPGRDADLPCGDPLLDAVLPPSPEEPEPGRVAPEDARAHAASEEEREPWAETVDPRELAAARRRHPSHPDFSPSPAVGDHERTVRRLEELAQDATPLADVRPGPLGTLDVYVFADGTTVCMTPGDRSTAERVAAALRAGDGPVLLGGSGISGAYALTFAWGEGHTENAYVLADRVIASI